MTGAAQPGDLVVYPSRYVLGMRVRVGHVGIVIDRSADTERTSGRAISQIGTGRYKLGAGGRNPAASTPLDRDGCCDCSGFAAWALGVDRFQPEKIDGSWISTTAIWRDAHGPRRMFEVVGPVDPALRVVHCAASKHAGPGAIRESDAALWARKNGAVIRLRVG